MGSKITLDDDCNHEIKSHLSNLESVFKSRDITLPTEVRLVKALVFPVVMYRYKNWTKKKAEHQKLMFSNYGVG